MAENADNESLSPSRVARRAPSKRRASSASADTESRLAQGLAQLGEPPRDESTLDLFASDPLHAPVQTTETDDRQGSLSGFERPEPVLVRPEVAVAQVTEATDSDQAAVAVSRNGVRGEPVAGRETDHESVANEEVVAEAESVVAVSVDGAADSKLTIEAVGPVTNLAQTPVLAGAALPDAVAAQANEVAAEPMLPGQALAQLRAVRTTAAAQRPAADRRAASRAAAADFDAAGDASSAGPGPTPEPPNARRPEASPVIARPVPASRDFGDFARAAVAADSAAESAGDDTTRQAPHELDRARSAAFAQTIETLNGVIADQRRSAADLSRRMKWMLGAVVGALLVTVAAGVAQTIVLSRFVTDANAQQQRIAQMMQDEQAAIAGSLAHLSSQAEAPAGQVASPSPARRTPHATAHGHRVRPASQ